MFRKIPFVKTELDVIGMTPIDALNKLFELNEKAKRI